MNINRFLLDLPRMLMSSAGDDAYHVLRIMTNGMTAPRIGKVLNFATRCMEEKEFYCEIGTFTGYSLLSAAYENNQHVVGIDNFSFNFGLMEKTEEEKGKIRENTKLRLSENLMRLGSGSIEFVDSDFRKVAFDKKDLKMGVFFIDGDHTYQEVLDSLVWAEPHLSNEAIILLDDVNIKGVSEALLDYLKDHKDYDLVFHCKPTCDESEGRFRDPLIHNGLSVVHYKRKEGLN